MSKTKDSKIENTASLTLNTPADAVRELIKYSIASESNIVSVEISNGGITDIIITDNGRGWALDALIKDSTAFQALHAIINESEFDMQTINPGNQKKNRLRYSHGDVLESLLPADISGGTRFQIQNLFFQNPKKYKTLRKDTIEGNSVLYVVKHYAIGYPSISFRFINNGKTIFHSPGNNNFDDCLKSIYSGYSFENMTQFDTSNNGATIMGYISKHEDKYNSSSDVFIYLNGYPIYSKNILSSILDVLNHMSISRFVSVLIVHISADDALSQSNEHNIMNTLSSLLEDRLHQISLDLDQNADSFSQDIPILNHKQLPVNTSVLPDPQELSELKGILFSKYLVIQQKDLIFICNTENAKSIDVSLREYENLSNDKIKELIVELFKKDKQEDRRSSVICFSLSEFNSLFAI